MTLRGFTLVELLVSLAILGLVASFAIPSIVSSFHQVQQRTALKEAIKTVKVLFNEGAMHGHTGGDLVTYVIDHANPAKICLTSAVAEGCSYFEEGTESAFELQSGVAFSGLAKNNPVTDQFYVDVNGDAEPNQHGEDVLKVWVCLQESGCSNPSESFPTSRDHIGYLEPHQTQAQSTDLYKDIFG